MREYCKALFPGDAYSDRRRGDAAASDDITRKAVLRVRANPAAAERALEVWSR